MGLTKKDAFLLALACACSRVLWCVHAVCLGGGGVFSPVDPLHNGSAHDMGCLHMTAHDFRLLYLLAWVT